MDNNIDKWGSLSMPERASLISLFTGSGVTSLDEMRALYNEYGNGGGIHIDPSKKGTFTSAAKRHGMGVQEFASRVLSNKDDYSTAMVKKANFARNSAKWHGDGGEIEQMFDSITPSEKIAINLRGLSRKQIKNKAYDLANRYGLNDDIIGTRRQSRIFNRTQKRWRDKGADKYIDKQLLDAIRNGDKQAFNDYITLGRDRFATKYAFPVIAGGIAGPAGMLAGMANTIFDAGINQTTGGLRDSWGDLFVDRYSHPVLSSLLEFTNPLNFSGTKVSGRLRGEHFYDVLTLGKADAVLAASVFHYGQFTVRQVKDYLKSRGVEVRF